MRTTLLSMALLAAASTAFAQDAEMKTGVVATDPTWGVSVADMSGRVILSRDVKAGESVQLNAASGVYVLTLYTADGVKVCKLKM